MFGLLVLISVVCVPILGMLAVGEWMRKRGLKHQQHVRKKRGRGSLPQPAISSQTTPIIH